MDVKLQGMGYLHHFKVPPTNYLLLIIKGKITDSQETWPKPSQSMIKLSITNKGTKGPQVPLLSRRQWQHHVCCTPAKIKRKWCKLRIRGTLVSNVKNMDWAGVWGVQRGGRRGCWMEEGWVWTRGGAHMGPGIQDVPGTSGKIWLWNKLDHRIESMLHCLISTNVLWLRRGVSLFLKTAH